MVVSQAKENILKKIRQALTHPVPLPFAQSEGAQSVFFPSAEDLSIGFAENFTRLQGKFAFCANENDLRSQLNSLLQSRKWDKVVFKENKIGQLLAISPYNDLASCEVAITFCECLIARTGTMVLSSAIPGGRTTSVYAPVHICIAYVNQLLYDLKDAMGFLKEKYGAELPSQIVFASGPSRTADIEKTLVTGVHGPKEVFCFLAEC
ncbi:MAG: LUD domain-containing protein [Ferruginibacter sp.]|nr:LUD domain-containing protein [Bacteroidota bacterium]MCW5917584.1 LUD domain-containing protein [Ferruginibacter sp.]